MYHYCGNKGVCPNLGLCVDRRIQTLIKTQIISVTCDEAETQLKPDGAKKRRGEKRREGKEGWWAE